VLLFANELSFACSPITLLCHTSQPQMKSRLSMNIAAGKSTPTLAQGVVHQHIQNALICTVMYVARIVSVSLSAAPQQIRINLLGRSLLFSVIPLDYR
jgi:hypothetical protein